VKGNYDVECPYCKSSNYLGGDNLKDEYCSDKDLSDFTCPECKKPMKIHTELVYIANETFCDLSTISLEEEKN